MSDFKLTIYVGQALTGAPKEFVVDFQNELKAELRKIPHVEVLDFVGLENGTELDVYLHDLNCTERAGLCAFIVDYPSTGLGMEVMIRDKAGRHSLFFARTDRRVTRMLLGYLKFTGRSLRRYDDVSDIIIAVKEYIDNWKHPD